MVEKTIYFSIFIQIFTTLISSDGLYKTLEKKDMILQDILKLEIFIQFIETGFYLWVIYALNDIHSMTSRRYIDWFITTPLMLLSMIIFCKYQEYKIHNIPQFTVTEFINDEWDNIKKIAFYNAMMLLFGYLGETEILPKNIAISIGFIFLYLSFSIIYQYAKKTELGLKLLYFLAIIWGSYGVSATFNVVEKNISYNLLDIVSKNFYGLYIYYKIKENNEKYISENR